MQLHRLQFFLEHLLRSSPKKIEWSQYLVEWSGAGWGVWVFFFHGVEPNLVEQSAPKHLLRCLRHPNHSVFWFSPRSVPVCWDPHDNASRKKNNTHDTIITCTTKPFAQEHVEEVKPLAYRFCTSLSIPITVVWSVDVPEHCREVLQLMVTKKNSKGIKGMHNIREITQISY